MIRIVQEGKHSIKDQIDKQVNDKERVLAAMENDSIIQVIADLIKERSSHRLFELHHKYPK